MQKSLLKTALFGALVVASASLWAQTDSFLADRHVGRGVACASCHRDKSPAPGAKVPMTACTTCHGSLDQVAERTKKKGVTPDSHYNHLVGLNCLECHQGHKPSQNACSTCHEIQYKVP